MLIQLLAVPEVPRVILGRLPRLPLEVFHLHSQVILLPFYHLLPGLSLETICVGSISDSCLYSISHTGIPAEVKLQRRTPE